MKTAFYCAFAAAFVFAVQNGLSDTLTPADKTFLARYEKVRAALAADNLPAAQEAAAPLATEGMTLNQSKSLPEARNAFIPLSEKAKKLTAGHPGYYLIYCPMVKHDWVQTSDKISNPYVTGDMSQCGEIKK